MKNNQGFKRMFIGILVVLLAWNGFLTYRVYDLSENSKKATVDGEGKVVEKVVTEFDTDVTKVVDQVKDKVVTVINIQNGNAKGSGSGVVYKNDGNKVYIVTNNHVTENGTDYAIQFPSGERLQGKLVGADVFSDLALLVVEEKMDVEPITLGDSSLTKVGEFVVAIGSPLDLEFANSVTFGIISGKDRKVPVDLNGDKVPDWDMVVTQTDAAINPGNSGGALVNMKGELIGINSMKFAAAQIEGMAFSIPVNEVTTIITQIEENGKVQYPIVGISGVSINDMNPILRNYYKIPESITQGVFIAELPANSPARKAGVKEGDVITRIDNKDVKSYRDFRSVVYAHKVGDSLDVTLNRFGEIIEVSIVLE